MNPRSIALVFVVSFALTMLGVMVFFKPIADADATRLTLPPAAGLIYIGLCTGIYAWAFNETGSCYKAAAIVVLPQVALIIDLALRGDRGPITALAGTALLIVTWLGAAFAHSRMGGPAGDRSGANR